MLFSTNAKLTDEEIDELIKTIDTKESRDRIVMAFVGIASTIALRYYRSTGLDPDDLQGEALLAVVDAVNRFPKVKHTNIGGYINKYIHQYCLRFIKRFSDKNSHITDQLIADDSLFDDMVVCDLIDNIVETETDEQVVQLKLEGYSDSEVADRLGVSRQYIWTIRKNLFKRLRMLK